MRESAGRIARERISILLGLAKENARARPERARRYVHIARRLAMRYRVRMGRLKRLFCRVCERYWVPGFNVRVRLDSRHKLILYECACGARRGMPYWRKE